MVENTLIYTLIAVQAPSALLERVMDDLNSTTGEPIFLPCIEAIPAYRSSMGRTHPDGRLFNMRNPGDHGKARFGMMKLASKRMRCICLCSG